MRGGGPPLSPSIFDRVIHLILKLPDPIVLGCLPLFRADVYSFVQVSRNVFAGEVLCGLESHVAIVVLLYRLENVARGHSASHFIDRPFLFRLVEEVKACLEPETAIL